MQVGYVVQRTVAEHAVEILGIGYLMAREILTFAVLEEAIAIFHFLSLHSDA